MSAAGLTTYAPEVGYLAVVLALGAAVYSAATSILGAQGRAELIASGRRALLAVAGLTTLASLILVYSFAIHDFSLDTVWQTSSRTTPLFYLLTGIWGGQAGSLLFWCWLLSLYASAAVLIRWRADVELLPWFTAITALVAAFFLFLVAFVANPFERLAVLPADGNGLNPLLQHPGMAFHPPTLYLGFTGMTIPYAFAMAALITRRTDAGWIHASRRWLLVAWAFLSIGLALGGRWAYDVLGWGGYWGWDPVENAAFMPWLAATAFLHSVMIQERRGSFKIWNMGLIILVFCLTIIGTFLTRAGLVSSVHSFAQSPIGPFFLIFTTAVVVGSLLLLWSRLSELRSDARIDSVVSRESAFLANNLLFMSALFAVFWGTLFPLVSEIVTDQRVAVRAPYFNRVVLPILWLVVLAMAVSPLIGWRRADPRRVGRALSRPLLISLGVVAGLWLAGVHHWIGLVGFGVAVLALIVTLAEYWRGVRARMARGKGPLMALGTLFVRNRRRYGGYTVHIGVALLAIGIVGSNVYQLEREQPLGVGDEMTIGDYRLTYDGLGVSDEPDKTVVFASLKVDYRGRPIGMLQPRRDIFRLREDQPMTIPSVMHRPIEDLYTILGTYDPGSQRVTVKVFVNPLISLVWLGMLVLVLGTFVAAWPDAAEARVLDTELKRLLGPAGVPAP